MITAKVINNPNLLGKGVFQYLMVSMRYSTWDQNSIYLSETDSIPFLVLDLIDPWSSFHYFCFWSGFVFGIFRKTFFCRGFCVSISCGAKEFDQFKARLKVSILKQQ